MREPGVDFFNTCPPTPSTSSVRLLGALAAQKTRSSFLIQNTCIQVSLQEDRCMVISFIEKVITRSKKASHEFHNLLISKFIDKGFEQCLTDTCIFASWSPVIGNKVKMIFPCDLDDLMLAGSHPDMIALEKNLDEFCRMNFLGELVWYSGWCFFVGTGRREF